MARVMSRRRKLFRWTRLLCNDGREGATVEDAVVYQAGTCNLIAFFVLSYRVIQTKLFLVCLPVSGPGISVSQFRK